MDLELQGRVALVAASSKGLGKASARALAAEGAHVVMCARTEETISAAAEEIAGETGAEVLALAANLDEADEVSRVVQAAIDRFGKLDIVVCNTGGPKVAPFGDLTDDDWKAAFESVHLAVVRLLREALPHMRERKWGRFISIQSTTVKQTLEAQMLSNGIRGGVVGLFKALSAQVAKDNVTLNVVLPGAMRTDRVMHAQTVRAEAAGKTLDEQLEGLYTMIPMGRLGDPDELGSMVAFLASERASYITGATYQVDGGLIRSNV